MKKPCEINVLIAFEESQTSCTEFLKMGFNVFSCDIQYCSGKHPERHIQNDVLPLLNGNCTFTTCDGKTHTINGAWDLIIAHPPCTYFTTASACRMFHNGKVDENRYQTMLEYRRFFIACLECNCKHVCIENPVPMKICELPDYTQIIQPYQFGEHFSKKTCLWLSGLPLLKPTDIVSDYVPYVNGGSKTSKGEKRKNTGLYHGSKKRSKSFVGIAKAFVSQYGNYVLNQ